MISVKLVALIVLFGIFFTSNLLPDAFGRSVYEPCSYTNPEKYTRDSNGNCILKTVSPNQIQNNGNEPCSYLHPEKYVRDSNGNCVARSSNYASPLQRSVNEPCSYLHPERFYRDPNTGQCIRTTPHYDVEPTIFKGLGGSSPFAKSGSIPWDSLLPVVVIISILMILNQKKRSSRSSRRRLK